MRDVAYCTDCGARLTLYVVGICQSCDFDRSGYDPERDERDTREAVGDAESSQEATEA